MWEEVWGGGGKEKEKPVYKDSLFKTARVRNKSAKKNLTRKPYGKSLSYLLGCH